MEQSSFPAATGNDLPITIIMDGNSRSARQRTMPRLVGHRAATKNVRRTVTSGEYRLSSFRTWQAA